MFTHYSSTNILISRMDISRKVARQQWRRNRVAKPDENNQDKKCTADHNEVLKWEQEINRATIYSIFHLHINNRNNISVRLVCTKKVWLRVEILSKLLYINSSCLSRTPFICWANSEYMKGTGLISTGENRRLFIGDKHSGPTYDKVSIGIEQTSKEHRCEVIDWLE